MFAPNTNDSEGMRKEAIQSHNKSLSSRLHTLRNWDHVTFISFYVLYPLYIVMALPVYQGPQEKPSLFAIIPNFRAGTTLPLATVRLFHFMSISIHIVFLLSQAQTNLDFQSIMGLIWFVVTLFPHWGGWYQIRVYYLAVFLARLLLTVLIATSIGLQATYLPRPLGSCENGWEWDTVIPRTKMIGKHHRVNYLFACEVHAVFAWRFEVFMVCWMALTTLSAGIIYAKFERIQRIPVYMPVQS